MKFSIRQGITSRNVGRIFTVPSLRRSYYVLGIESSCDDSSTALLDRYDVNQAPRVLGEFKSTLDNKDWGGVVPNRAHAHHMINMPEAVRQALDRIPTPSKRPDLICATRGPGMVGCLSVGFMMAKGLAMAYQVPLIGVHHMLGHLLTPRMETNGRSPQYPFVSLLASGGHTMLVLSRSTLDHEILVDTIDVAIGDAVDKTARHLGLVGDMLGPELEKLAREAEKESLQERTEIIEQELEEIGKILPEPLHNIYYADRKVQPFSFCSMESAMRRYIERYSKTGTIEGFSLQAKQQMARIAQDKLFLHTVGRIKLILRKSNKLDGVQDFVCSGGVAANARLRQLLTELLPEIKHFHFPPPKLCTDNGTMIAWAGIELWEKEGLSTQLDVDVYRKWSLEDIMNVPGWTRTEAKASRIYP